MKCTVWWAIFDRFVHHWNHHHRQDTEHFHCHEKVLYVHLQPIPPSTPGTLDLFVTTDWFVFPSILCKWNHTMFSLLCLALTQHEVIEIIFGMSVFSVCFWVVFHCLDGPQCIYPVTCHERVHCFWFGAIVNKAAVSLHVKSSCGHVFISLGLISMDGMVGLYRGVFLFS